MCSCRYPIFSGEWIGREVKEMAVVYLENQLSFQRLPRITKVMSKTLWFKPTNSPLYRLLWLAVQTINVYLFIAFCISNLKATHFHLIIEWGEGFWKDEDALPGSLFLKITTLIVVEAILLGRFLRHALDSDIMYRMLLDTDPDLNICVCHMYPPLILNTWTSATEFHHCHHQCWPTHHLNLLLSSSSRPSTPCMPHRLPLCCHSVQI